MIIIFLINFTLPDLYFGTPSLHGALYIILNVAHLIFFTLNLIARRIQNICTFWNGWGI